MGARDQNQPRRLCSKDLPDGLSPQSLLLLFQATSSLMVETFNSEYT